MSEHVHTTHQSDNRGLKTLKSYIVGYVLCLILTFASFGIVIKNALEPQYTYVLLAALAVLQLLVQVIFFLRLNASPEGRWNLMPFLFTIFIVLVIVIGSLWIMFNLNYRMVH